MLEKQCCSTSGADRVRLLSTMKRTTETSTANNDGHAAPELIEAAFRSTMFEHLRHHVQAAGDCLPADLRQLLLDADNKFLLPVARHPHHE
ncbi:hypothetical protein [Burkholderia contaminans]|uniref:hypothetical protein n=1 Tax=Burkholderia contaminans TaxID=488447 RepID=UPI001C2E2DF0|nr:hypothetical protein [Burkholderia contaminans]